MTLSSRAYERPYLRESAPWVRRRICLNQYYAKDLCKGRIELSALRELVELTVFDSDQQFLHRACSRVGHEELYW
jgi:hypothetical protein